jgi:hypothetical protein
VDGFTADLDEAEKACKLEVGSLPQAAAMLRGPIADLLTFDSWNGAPQEHGWDAPYHLQLAWEGFRDALGQRHIRGCDIIDDNAEALRDIITLYRRVDGQR